MKYRNHTLERQKSATCVVLQMSPLRDYKTVAKMLGVSWQTVWQDERNAIYTITKRMREYVATKRNDP